jgi:hypothetical protein
MSVSDKLAKGWSDGDPTVSVMAPIQPDSKRCRWLVPKRMFHSSSGNGLGVAEIGVLAGNGLVGEVREAVVRTKVELAERGIEQVQELLLGWVVERFPPQQQDDDERLRPRERPGTRPRAGLPADVDETPS